MPRAHHAESLTVDQLIDRLIDDLQQLRGDARWKQSMAHGARRTGSGARSSEGTHSDPTAVTAAQASHLRRALAAVHRDLTWLYQRKLPEIAGRLELDDDKPRIADDNTADERRHLGPARLDGGISAYRGDTTVSSSRPDLAEALDAQRRRLDRGEGWGGA